MAEAKADPGALVVRYLERLKVERVAVFDVPGVEEAAGIREATGATVSHFHRSWPTHRALTSAGFVSEFGPWLPKERADGAILFLPKGRERTRMTLAALASWLPAGAPIWVVGAKRGGVATARGDVEALADVGDIESGRHAKLIQARLREPVAASLESFAVGWSEPLPGGDLQICSYPGVFSHGRLDDGTRLLLESVGSVRAPTLDVGCGSGVIGCWAQRRHGAGVTLVDSDALAIEAARRTLAANGLVGEVEAADVLPESGLFREIVSNPPFHVGHAQDHAITRRLIAGARARLRPGGLLTLVCNRFLKVPDPLNEAFGGFDVLADDGRYRVYRAGGPRRAP